MTKIQKVVKKTVKKVVKKEAKAEPKAEAPEYDVQARKDKVKAIENAQDAVEMTISQVITELANARCKLVGELMSGDRVVDKEIKAEKVKELDKEIADLKLKKVAEDAAGK